MEVNQIIYGGETLIDLTGDTVTPETLAEGVIAHNAAGEEIVGTMKANNPELGDIRHTVRTDLDDTWLLCNGEEVSKEAYPELNKLLYETTCTNTKEVNLLPLLPTPRDVVNTKSGALIAASEGCVLYTRDPTGNGPVATIQLDNNTTFYGVAAREVSSTTHPEHGYVITTYEWVAVGVGEVGDDGTACGVIYATNDPLGEWTRKEYLEPDGTAGGFYGVAYDDATGYWCACGTTGNVFYTDDPFGEWVGFATGHTANFDGIACYGGTWVAFDAAKGFVTNDLTGGSVWTQVALGGTCLDLCCYDGLWVGVSSSAALCASDPFGTWTATTIESTSNYKHVEQIVHTDDGWLAFGYYQSSTGSTKQDVFWCAEDPQGDWVRRAMKLLNGSNTAYGSTKGASVNEWGELILVNDYSGTTIIGVDQDHALLDNLWVQQYFTVAEPGVFSMVHGTDRLGEDCLIIATDTGLLFVVSLSDLDHWFVHCPYCIARSVETNRIYINGLACGEGVFVAVGSTGSDTVTNSAARPALYRAFDPRYQWGFYQISDEPCGLTAAAYGNGVWVAVGQASSSSSFGATVPIAFVSNSVGAENWPVYQISATSGKPLRVVYDEVGGFWGVITSSALYIAADPTGEWTQAPVTATTAFTDLICVDGTWVITDSSSTYVLHISEDPANIWETVAMTFDEEVTASAPTFITYSDGKWFVKNKTSVVCQAADPRGVWSVGVNTGTFSSIDIEAIHAADHNVYGVYYSTSSMLKGFLFQRGYQVLPTIAPEGAYAYIKAKE